MVGSLQPLPSPARLLVPRRRILWPFPPSSAFRAPAGGFPVDSCRQQRSFALNHIPPLPISRGLDYPLGSGMHLVVIHPRLDARGRPFPRSPRSCSPVNLRVVRPLTPGPQRQPSPLRTPHGHPGVQGIFLTSRGQVFHRWPMLPHSMAISFPIPRGCCLAPVAALSCLRCLDRFVTPHSRSPHPVPGPAPAPAFLLSFVLVFNTWFHRTWAPPAPRRGPS